MYKNALRRDTDIWFSKTISCCSYLLDKFKINVWFIRNWIFDFNTTKFSSISNRKFPNIFHNWYVMSCELLHTFTNLKSMNTKQSTFDRKVQILTCFPGIKTFYTDKWLLLVSLNAAWNYKVYLIIVKLSLPLDRYVL